MLKSRFLARLFARLDGPQDLGVTPDGHRLIFNVTGGTFEGPRIKATVLPGGGDWLSLRADGTAKMDVRGTMRSDDGALIYVYYGGRVAVPIDLLPQAMDHMTETPIDPSRYYFRSAPFFETSSPKYAWLNNIAAIGVGGLGHGGVSYDIYEIE